MAERVFITGIGAVTPLGIGRAKLWQGALCGRKAVQQLDRFDATPFRSKVAGQVNDFDPAALLDRKEIQRTDRFSQFAIAAAQLAFDDAAFTPRCGDPDFGIWIGSALGGVVYAERQYEAYQRAGLKAVHPMLALSVFGAASCCNVAIHFGLHGPSIANSNSCAAGAVAIGDAFRAVRDGVCRRALAGGAEAPLAPLTFGAFDLIRAMSTRNDDPATASRPFDARRDGFVMAEAACLLLLEREEDVLARGVLPYAEIAGFGLTNDGQHMTAPRPDAREAARSMLAALKEAGADPSEVVHVNAHGSSTLLNDPTESKAIRAALGPRTDNVTVSAIKGMMGHALGATGAVEAALCAIGIRESTVMPLVNLEQPGEGCDLRYAPGTPLSMRQPLVLSNSFGFGGLNASIALRAA
ncbi:MAG TPA: beta-ketoacyl-[acyl-carrier-protein] synthase family protein [Candidatus Acidoferrales bacterium]|nr:beta-ketoacyl-[acyl-carrier-protein] synthase family protein [Candidatus Acidoferrales bacterium]